MDALELRAYEVLGYWTVVLVHVEVSEADDVRREMLYRGEHVPIDETDPVLRAALLLHQVQTDLSWAYADNSASPPITDRPVSH